MTAEVLEYKIGNIDAKLETLHEQNTVLFRKVDDISISVTHAANAAKIAADAAASAVANATKAADMAALVARDGCFHRKAHEDKIEELVNRPRKAADFAYAIAGIITSVLMGLAWLWTHGGK